MNQGEKLMILARNSPKGVIKIAEEIGMTPQHFARLYKKETLKQELINKFCEVTDNTPLEFDDRVPKMFITNTKECNVSYYDISAVAGFDQLGEQKEHIIDRWFLPMIKGDHIAVNVIGNSMESTLSEGDVIIAKKLTSKQEIDNNEIHIIVYEGTPLIKRVFFNNLKIELRSDNPFYDTIFADKDLMTSFYRVVLIMRSVGHRKISNSLQN